jgi:ATP-dependent DNA ligase
MKNQISDKGVLPADYEPMEAQLVESMPIGKEWQYEPKWDGFRCLACRSGDKIELRSKNGRELARYFPELEEKLLQLKAEDFVLDGEIVVPTKKSFSFDALLQRIHPAPSRIKKLARETPAILICFDLLIDENGQPLMQEPLTVRRQALDKFGEKYIQGNKDIIISPVTTDPDVCQDWHEKMGDRLDGIVAKRVDLPYQTGNRHGMQKIKWLRTADCVIGGFRYSSKDKEVGSLLLGLYDSEGKMHHVGFCSSFTAKERQELTKLLTPLIGESAFTGSAPGGPSRWSSERSQEWQPLQAELIGEFRYDHFTNGRFRHGTKLMRWRPDKKLSQCTFAQIGPDSEADL